MEKPVAHPSPPQPKHLFTCEYEDCGKAFKQQSDLKNHIRTHTGEKPYVCCHSQCGKKFATNSQLRRHERSHSSNKPCICIFPGCGKAFRTVGHLKRHQKAHLATSGIGGTEQLAALYAQSLAMLCNVPADRSTPQQQHVSQASAEKKLPSMSELTTMQPKVDHNVFLRTSATYPPPCLPAPLPQSSAPMLPSFYHESHKALPMVPMMYAPAPLMPHAQPQFMQPRLQQPQPFPSSQQQQPPFPFPSSVHLPPFQMPRLALPMLQTPKL